MSNNPQLPAEDEPCPGHGWWNNVGGYCTHCGRYADPLFRVARLCRCGWRSRQFRTRGEAYLAFVDHRLAAHTDGNVCDD